MDKTQLNSLKEKVQHFSILYVEDEVSIREKTTIFLHKIFSDIDVAENGQEGLEKYSQKQYDIVITDISMPKMNGLEMIEKIRIKNEKQEIIVISAYTDAEYFTQVIELHITGYILKPLNLDQTLNVLEQSIDKLMAFRENEMYKTQLEAMVEERTKEVLQLQDQLVDNYEKAIYSFVRMIEARDTYTGGHSERVATYSRDIAKEMGFSKEECALIFKAGILHDIGKVIMPDAILLKPGRLTDKEYALIKDHVETGYKILSEVPMYEEISQIVYTHHERYNGSGYPLGKKGKEIPMFGRIMGVADTFDAMTTSRAYKRKKSISAALEELELLSGEWFDPQVVMSAVKVLKKVNIDAAAAQEPHSYTDDERFAYFYKDQLTGAYNQHYLDLLLRKNQDEKKSLSLHVLYLKNFTTYNHSYSWNDGDVILKTFVAYLQSRYGDCKVFRIFGDDFVLLQKEYKEIDINTINALPLLRDANLFCHYDDFDVLEKGIISHHELQEA